MLHRPDIAALLAGLIWLGGCQSSSHQGAGGTIDLRPAAPALVAPGATAGAHLPEFSRNDRRLGQTAPAMMPHLELVEVRSHDRLRTIHGRPIESSWTRTRTIRRTLSTY
jgi:hypothetical protein